MMRLSLEWLREFVPLKDAPEALANRLTLAGFEVTGIAAVGDDTVFDLEITPNRADCLSVVGLARELAALTNQRLRLSWQTARRRAAAVAGPRLDIRIEDAQGCRRYVGRLLEDIRVGPSPAWMQRRLAACGLRPINNVVDVTNYVLLETGQPLHAFDYDRLADGRLIVRRARAGERIQMLDGLTHALAPEMLVIADAKEAVAVAGVMGGRSSEIGAATRRVLLESAEFDPLTVRRTARRLGLTSESSYRFERGIDPEGVAVASERAAALILETAGGRQTAARTVGRAATKPTIVAVDPDRAARRLGIPIGASAGAGLRRLGFGVAGGARHWRVTVPSFRRDVRGQVDVEEELARLHGYDRLPAAQATAPLAGVSHDPAHVFARNLRDTLAGAGLSQAMTWALISAEELARVDWPASAEQCLRVANPLSQDHVVLRPTLLPGLARVVAKNIGLGVPSVRLFEVGTVFPAAAPEHQGPRLGIAIAGLWERSWQQRREADVFRLKGLVERVVAASTGAPIQTRPASAPWAEPGHALEILVDGQPMGLAGEVAARVLKRFDCGQRAWFAELLVDALRRVVRQPAAIAAPAPFPPVKRDLSVLIPRDQPYARVAAAIREAGAPLASRIDLVDRYAGPQVPPDAHSLTFSIEYRDPAKTLTAAEVEQVHRAIGQALADRFGAQLR
jgi:phenylalanyl-tRNA synthetase beta chain